MDEWDIDSIRACCGFEKFHVCDSCGIGDFLIGVEPLISVFIFDLVDEYVSSFCDLVLGDDLGYFGEKWCPGVGISGIVVSKSAVGSCSQPAGETSC